MTSIWAPFDYALMASEARQEQDRLMSVLRKRRARGPESPERAMAWEQENRRLYDMYLEQRKNAKEFARRAAKRAALAAGRPAYGAA